MNSMTKKLPLIVSISTAASLALLAIYQSDVISDLKEVLSINKKKLTLTEQALHQEMETTESLRKDIAVLNDSIYILNLTISNLNEQVEEQLSIIKNLNTSLKKQENKVAQLTREINQLEANARQNENKIKVLSSERDSILTRMAEDDRRRIAAMNEQRQKEQEQADKNNRLLDLHSKMDGKKEKLDARMQDKQDESPMQAPEPIINQAPGTTGTSPSANEEMSMIIKNRQQERLNNILTQTKVHFSGISLRNRENSNELKKIKDNGNGWRYTFIDFDLSNTDKEAIMDETFIIQIYDLDKNVVVPFNERNNSFPNSDQGAIGYKFKYDGKPVSIKYVNTQQKEGENFEIRLIYFKNELTFNVVNGRKKIVENSQVIVP